MRPDLPQEWKVAALESVAEVRTGVAKSAERTRRDPVRRPYLRVANVQDGYLKLDEIKEIEVERKHAPRYTLKAGDVLLTEGGDFDKLGRGAVWRDQIQGCLHQNHVFAVRPGPDVIPEYLAAYTGSPEGRRYFLTCSKQTTNLASINSSQLKAMPIPLPSLREQRRIAAALGVWDEAIDRTERLVTAKRRLRAWIGSSLLTGKVRLRGFSKPWNALRLSTVLHEHGASSAGDEPVFSVSVHKGLVNQIDHLGRSFSAADTRHYNRVLPDDIVYTKSPTGEFPFGVIKQSTATEPVIVSPLYAVYTPKTRALGVLLEGLFESPIATGNYLRPLVQKGAKNTIAITNRRFLEGTLLLPTDPAETDTLAQVLRGSRCEIATLERRLDALRSQKRGLLQKLLTGGSRLPERSATVA